MLDSRHGRLLKAAATARRSVGRAPSAAGGADAESRWALFRECTCSVGC